MSLLKTIFLCCLLSCLVVPAILKPWNALWDAGTARTKRGAEFYGGNLNLQVRDESFPRNRNKERGAT